jgi:hypothetical protein
MRVYFRGIGRGFNLEIVKVTFKQVLLSQIWHYRSKLFQPGRAVCTSRMTWDLMMRRDEDFDESSSKNLNGSCG